ncbi:DNA-binding transcriptional LysR family regulator [Sphingomonas insulae]|uniref:HTH lysR-type domain-containing protein n=1 Tax=Sphingomonas insulae TaxID=424800 RepID=A0ABN1HY25_9SPHN|nr:LysR family transcriptional regulator [Sphingomonas insulae]NIJ29677.1 DNA-binding transcriptional LysR family regulator [Sphingomonas insulae]
MIDRFLIRYFLGIVDHGSFSAAALHCRVTQPTLSAGIAKLEGALAQRLFDRSSKRVRLTEAGAQFAHYARRIEAEFTAAERAVQAARPRRLIRIGVAPTIATAWIGAALAAVRAGGCGEQVEIVEGRSNELQAKLDRGRLDAVLGIVDDDAAVLVEERYGVAMALDHPLAGRDAVAADEIAGDTMIVRRHCEALPQVSRFFTERGVRPFMAARTISDDRAAAYVAAGLGITVMPRSLATAAMAMPALVGFDAVRRIGFRTPDAGVARLHDSAAYRAFGAALRAIGGGDGDDDGDDGGRNGDDGGDDVGDGAGHRDDDAGGAGPSRESDDRPPAMAPGREARR